MTTPRCFAATLLAVVAALPAPAMMPADAWTALAGGEAKAAEEQLLEELQEGRDPLRAAIGLAALREARSDADGAVAVLATALERDASGPLAAGALARTLTLVHRTADGGDALVPVLERLVDPAVAVADPEVRSSARETLAALLIARGEVKQAQRLLVDDGGRLTRWSLMGPFGRLERIDLLRTFPPERGQLSPADWDAGPHGLPPFRLDTRFPDGRVMLPVQFHGFGVVYAAAEVEVARPVRLRLRAASPAAFRLFVDGKLALERDPHRSHPPLSLAGELSLEPGRHRLLVKLSNGGRFTPFTLALESPGGGPPPGDVLREVELSTEPTAGARFTPQPSPLDGPFEAVALEDPAAAVAAAWWLRMRDLDRASGQLLLRAEERWPDSVLLKVLLGEHYKNATTGASPDEDLARARGLLEQALAADPSLLRAELLIGQMDVAAGRLAEAAERAARVLAAAPGDPDALLLEHRAAVRRGWGVEAEAALSAARSVAPGRLDLLDAAIDFYEASGAIEKLASARLERARRTPGHEDRAELLARAGRTGEAVALWRGMLELRPTYIYGWIGLVRTLVDAERYDDALVALDEAEQAFPQEPWIPFQRAGVLRLQGREDAARAALARTVALEPGRIALRALLDEQAGSLDMERWLVDVDALLAEAAAPPAGVDSALLADIAVVLLDREGGQTELYQGVNGVFTRAGVEREGELELQPGARLEKVRIHKEDGREVDVVLGDLPSLSLPGLEPGDAVEYVWRRYIPPGLLPGALDNRSIFLFQGPDRQYELSRYVVMHDPSIEVQVCGNEEGLRREVTTENGLTIRSWTAESMRQIKLEPHVPNQLEIVPHVRLGMGMSWPDVGDLVRSAVAGMLHPDPPLPGLAEDVRRRAASSAPRDLARSLHEVVNERLEPGGTALRLGLPASASASAGEGNRIGVALALAESLGLRPRLLFTRPLALRGRDLDCPTPGLFSYVLVEIPADEGPIYLDYNDVDHPFDRMPLEIGGSDGLRVPLDPAETATVVDVPYRAPGVLERVDADLALEADGTFAGTLTVAARGSRAAVLRKVLRELPEDRIELAYESVVTRTFPGAEVLATRVEGLEEGDDEVRLRFGFEKGHWGRRTATGFALPMVHHPLPILSEYASLPTRRYPLLFDLADFRHDRIRIQLPAGMRLGDLPEGLQEENAFGRYSVSATLDDAGALLLERTAALPPRRIETDQYPAFRDFARRVEQAEAREVPVSVASPSLAPPG